MKQDADFKDGHIEGSVNGGIWNMQQKQAELLFQSLDTSQVIYFFFFFHYRMKMQPKKNGMGRCLCIVKKQICYGKRKRNR